MGEPAQQPNVRQWRLETEADIEHWWYSEVSDVVLAAWATYPAIIQTSHTKPLTDVNIAENIDCTYAMYVGDMRVSRCYWRDEAEPHQSEGMASGRPRRTPEKACA